MTCSEMSALNCRLSVHPVRHQWPVLALFSVVEKNYFNYISNYLEFFLKSSKNLIYYLMNFNFVKLLEVQETEQCFLLVLDICDIYLIKYKYNFNFVNNVTFKDH